MQLYKNAARPVGLSAALPLLLMLCVTNTAHAYRIKMTKTGNMVHWSTPVVTLYVDPKLQSQLGADDVNTALTIATEAWRGLPNVPDLEISQQPAPGYQTDQRTNGIYYMDPWPFGKEQLAVTVSTYDVDGRMIGADVLVNGETSYALLPDGNDQPNVMQHDIAAVLTHEMGHVLGLDEDIDDQTATMWPYIRAGEVHQRTLAEDDEKGATAVYHDVTFATAINHGCTQASVVGAVPPTSLSSWSAVLLAGFGLVRVRTLRRKLTSRARQVRVRSTPPLRASWLPSYSLPPSA